MRVDKIWHFAGRRFPRSMSMRAYKTYHYAVILGYIALSIHYISRMPADQRLFAAAVAAIFFVLYLLVRRLFEQGLRQARTAYM